MDKGTHLSHQGYLRTTSHSEAGTVMSLFGSVATSFNSCVLGWLSDWYQQSEKIRKIRKYLLEKPREWDPSLAQANLAMEC